MILPALAQTGHDRTIGALHADAEGFSRPVRVGVGDEVRELCAGDRWAFALGRETTVAR